MLTSAGCSTAKTSQCPLSRCPVFAASTGACGSHCENHSELCLAAYHPRVCLSRFFKRICFNHGTHTTQFGEAQCVLGIGWCARSPTLNGSTSADELHRCDLDRIECHANNDELAVRPEPWMSSDMALELGAVARITRAPPSFCNSSTALVDWLSMYVLAPSFFASSALSGRRPMAATL
jgi:hypothetical protein